MSARHSNSLKRTLVFAWAALLFVVIAGLAWANHSLSQQFRTSFRWVTHTQELLQRIEETVSLLKDIESGQRGYALSGETSYLEPYHHALTTIHGNIDDLLDLTADNPRQHSRVKELSALINDRIAIAEEFVAARETQGAEAVTILTKTGRGRSAMEAVRNLSDEIKRDERRLLRTRQRDARESLRHQQLFGLGMIALIILATAGIFWLQRRLSAAEDLIRICAWTRQVHHNGQWMPVENFLQQRFGLKTSHAMSEQAAEEFRREAEGIN